MERFRTLKRGDFVGVTVKHPGADAPMRWAGSVTMMDSETTYIQFAHEQPRLCTPCPLWFVENNIEVIDVTTYNTLPEVPSDVQAFSNKRGRSKSKERTATNPPIASSVVHQPASAETATTNNNEMVVQSSVSALRQATNTSNGVFRADNTTSTSRMDRPPSSASNPLGQHDDRPNEAAGPTNRTNAQELRRSDAQNRQAGRQTEEMGSERNTTGQARRRLESDAMSGFAEVLTNFASTLRRRDDRDDEDDFVTSATAVAQAMELRDGKTTWKPLAPGLKVPLQVEERFCIFYPDLWIGGSRAEYEKKYDNFFRFFGVSFRFTRKADECEWYKSILCTLCFNNYERTPEGSMLTRVTPTNKTEWEIYYRAASFLFGALATGSPRGSADAYDRAMLAFKDGKVDFAKLWEEESKEKDKPGTQQQPSNEELSKLTQRISAIEKTQFSTPVPTTNPHHTMMVEYTKAPRGGRGGRGGTRRRW